MARAILNDVVIADSESTEIVEGNYYFPPHSVNQDYLRPSDTRTVCPWKATASYYTVVANGHECVDAAWYYPEAKDAAKRIEGYVAFWKDVKVQD